MKALFWVADNWPLICPLASYKGTNPIHEISTFMIWLYPKGLTSKHYHIESKVSTYKFRGREEHKHLSIILPIHWSDPNPDCVMLTYTGTWFQNASSLEKLSISGIWIHLYVHIWWPFCLKFILRFQIRNTQSKSSFRSKQNNCKSSEIFFWSISIFSPKESSLKDICHVLKEWTCQWKTICHGIGRGM